MLISFLNRPVLAWQQPGQHSRRWLVECPRQHTPVTLRRLVYVFAASIFSSNLLFFCFVRDFIQDNGVCNVLHETAIVANFCKARLGGVAINYFGFCIKISANTDCLLSKLFFSQSMFWCYHISKCHISGNNVNVDFIEMSLFCSGCALFEYVIKREYVFTDKRLILACAVTILVFYSQSCWESSILPQTSTYQNKKYSDLSELWMFAHLCDLCRIRRQIRVRHASWRCHTSPSYSTTVHNANVVDSFLYEL